MQTHQKTPPPPTSLGAPWSAHRESPARDFAPREAYTSHTRLSNLRGSPQSSYPPSDVESPPLPLFHRVHFAAVASSFKPDSLWYLRESIEAHGGHLYTVTPTVDKTLGIDYFVIPSGSAMHDLAGGGEASEWIDHLPGRWVDNVWVFHCLVARRILPAPKFPLRKPDTLQRTRSDSELSDSVLMAPSTPPKSIRTTPVTPDPTPSPEVDRSSKTKARKVTRPRIRKCDRVRGYDLELWNLFVPFVKAFDWSVPSASRNKLVEAFKEEYESYRSTDFDNFCRKYRDLLCQESEGFARRSREYPAHDPAAKGKKGIAGRAVHNPPSVIPDYHERMDVDSSDSYTHHHHHGHSHAYAHTPQTSPSSSIDDSDDYFVRKRKHDAGARAAPPIPRHDAHKRAKCVL